MTGFWSTPLPGVLLTLAAYLLCERVQARLGGNPFLNPVAGAIALLSLALAVSAVPYDTYFASARVLHLLLGPATVALAVPLYGELPRLRRLLGPIAAGLLAGNLAALTSAIALARLFGAGRPVLLSLAPKSVTTPIAMGIAERLGGLPSLTAVLVILTGVLGAVLGPWLLDRLRIRDEALRGLAMGVSSHALGTATIYRESAEAGGVSGLAMGLSGLLTALLAPALVAWLVPG
jgi:predicted murein hydrolase (TIGR00659 family)